MVQGLKLNNITSVVLVNATTKTIDLTPAAGKRWWLIASRMVNADDVQRSCHVIAYQEAAATNRLYTIIGANALAAAAQQVFPSPAHSASDEVGALAIPNHCIEGAEMLRYTWTTGGASTGGTDADGLSLVVLEEVIS